MVTTHVGPYSGETQAFNTSIMIKGNSDIKLSMFITPFEPLSITFLSGGYIDKNYAGRVEIKIGNFCKQKIYISEDIPVGYIIIKPFSELAPKTVKHFLERKGLMFKMFQVT